jgi:alpha-L-fucosidase
MNKWISALVLALCACSQVTPPAPYGTCPTSAQVAWHRQELLMFYHFGQATYSGNDGENDTCNGTPWSEELLLKNYAAHNLDVDQWVKVAAQNGFKEVILTAKHHDGFCLWDNPESTADIANEACVNHQDVVQAVRDACNKYGVNLGIYLSPWDRTIEVAGLDIATYEEKYKHAVNDLMTRYAPVVEFWFDGNHAGAFDWPSVNRAVLDVNPDCLIFSDGGPGCRWVGNEEGRAGETNWNTLNVKERGITPGHAPGDYHTYLGQGDQGGSQWVPTECDFSIQNIRDPDGWFYDPTDRVKTPEELLAIYYTSVGRGGIFLMNVPPSPEGIIGPAEVASIEGFTALREKVFGTNLAQGATAQASDSRGKGYEAGQILDADYDSYYAAPDGVKETDLEVFLNGEKTFNRVMLQEYIPLGQRVESFKVEVHENGEWTAWGEGTTIGHKRILLGRTVTADAVRIHIKALACPLINGFGLYNDTIITTL